MCQRLQRLNLLLVPLQEDLCRASSSLSWTLTYGPQVTNIAPDGGSSCSARPCRHPHLAWDFQLAGDPVGEPPVRSACSWAELWIFLSSPAGGHEKKSAAYRAFQIGVKGLPLMV